MAGPRRPGAGRNRSVEERRRRQRARRQAQGSAWVDPGNPFGINLTPEQQEELAAAFQTALEQTHGGVGEWVENNGLRVTLTSEPGYTTNGLLEAPFRFQVPPMEEFAQQYAFEHSEYTTLRNGTFTRKTAQALTQIQFQTMFVDYNTGWESWRSVNTDPTLAVRRLRELLESGSPFRMTAGNPALWDENDVDMLAVLKSMSVSEKAGEPDARYVDMTFQEWRPPTIIKRKQLGKKTKDKQHRPSRSRPKTPATIWIHPNGEAHHRNKRWTTNKPVSLNGLSVYFYGQSAHWRTIAAKNNITGVSSKDNLGAYVTRVNNGKALKLTIPKLPNTGGTAAP